MSAGSPTREPESSAAVGEKPQTASDCVVAPRAFALQLRHAFDQARQRIRANVSRRQARDRLPRFLMLGDAASGKTSLLSHLGLNALGEPPDSESLEAHPPCQWWLFEQGMVLDIAGNVLFQTDTHDEGDERWQSLLRRLQRDRPARPLDGVILTLSFTDLTRQATPGAHELSHLKDKATCLTNKLVRAQRMFDLRFPIYILVTKCDQIHGFQSLCRNLPVPRHQDIFGWSNPYAIDTAYSPAWVDEAFHYLCRHLVQTQSDVFATRLEVRDGDGLFLHFSLPDFLAVVGHGRLVVVPLHGNAGG